ncbi:hypothetical protein Ae201684_010847 [Aphanomyces euteiches]|uniref:Uncharacterized protein n=1 Tax=Aphanomyces euteiches TaxID=100861 RepID=A0A6G0WWI8_9STRA|nr:hypothetical protein Ae201684_010847 [Aphanomyces euteiches]
MPYYQSPPTDTCLVHNGSASANRTSTIPSFAAYNFSTLPNAPPPGLRLANSARSALLKSYEQLCWSANRCEPQ